MMMMNKCIETIDVYNGIFLACVIHYRARHNYMFKITGIALPLVCDRLVYFVLSCLF